jgi:hypothetical protein
MSPVARDDKGKALRRMSDITDHRMMRGGGLCDQFQAYMKNEVRRIFMISVGLRIMLLMGPHYTARCQWYQPLNVERYTPGLLMNYLTYSIALSYAELYLFNLLYIHMPLDGCGCGPGIRPPFIYS